MKRISLVPVVLTLLLAACATTGPVAKSFDFDQRGMLTRNEPGLTPGVWYLMYGEANETAVPVRIMFDENSECITSAGRGACERSIFEDGLKVEIRGSRQEIGVLVAEMEVE